MRSVKRIERKLFGLALAFVASVPAWAQLPVVAPAPSLNAVFDRLDGLSHNTVFCLFQDRKGFLWIGTSDGLNRYDGYEVVVYRHDPADPSSLSNNSVKAIVEDRNGVLWIGTDRGLDRLDRRSDRFVHYSLSGEAHGPVESVMKLHVDRSGRLWVAASSGLYRFDEADGRFVGYALLSEQAVERTDAVVNSLHESADGSLWVGLNQGKTVYRYDPERDDFDGYDLPNGSLYEAVLFYDTSGSLWVTTPAGIRAYDPFSGRFMLLRGVSGDLIVHAMLQDRQKRVWIGTDDGLHLYNLQGRTSRRVRAEDSAGAFLQHRIKALYEDRAGALWVGTFSGLYRMDPHAKPFFHFQHLPDDPNTLSGNTVMAILEDRKTQLWVGTLGAGLNRIDRQSGSVTRFRSDPADPTTLCHDSIWSLFEDSRGWVWVGTDAGVCRYDPHSGRFVRYKLSEEAGAVDPPVNAIREDSRGHVWLATNQGLFELAGQNGGIHRHASPGPGLLRWPAQKFFVQSLYVDERDGLWMGVFGGGLFHYDMHTGRFSHVRLFLNEEEELVSEGIWSIHASPEAPDVLWLGSDLGLTRLDRATGDIQHINHRDGLPGSIIYAILPDDRPGRLWLSTNQGLVRFDARLREPEHFRVYDAGDGLINTEFNRRAAFKGRDGTMYFGGLNGLTWFRPAKIYDNPVVPPVVLTRVEISNQDSTRSLPATELESLELSFRDYTVQFEFAALNFTNPSKNRYRYRLEGFDEGWIEAGTSRMARYTNIPPGSYVLRVAGSNNDGRWNERGAALRLVVKPPFWQTGWFRAAAVLLVLGLLWTIYRVRVHRLLEVERMRLRIAGDLHDDIGANLSSIALLSDIVKSRDYVGDRERGQLARISQSARGMVDMLRDIVWSIDPESDRPGMLVRRMRETATAMLGHISWQFDAPDRDVVPNLNMNERRHLFLSFKEILHNVVRHANASVVHISLVQNKEGLELVVEDNGIGFDVEADHSGTGLKHLQERVSRMSGVLTIERRRQESGTIVRIRVPGGARAKAKKRRKRVVQFWSALRYYDDRS